MAAREAHDAAGPGLDLRPEQAVLETLVGGVRLEGGEVVGEHERVGVVRVGVRRSPARLPGHR